MMKFKSFFRYFYWLYILILILTISLWVTVFDNLAKNEPYEEINIIYFGSNLDGEQLKNDLLEFTSGFEQEIKAVNVEVRNVEKDFFSTLLTTKKVTNDIVIISEEYMFEYIGGSCFRTLKNVNIDAKYYMESEVKYGIIVHDKEIINNKFSEYYTGESNIYLFFSPDSVNLGRLYNNGEKENDAAIKVAEYLVGK